MDFVIFTPSLDFLNLYMLVSSMDSSSSFVDFIPPLSALVLVVYVADRGVFCEMRLNVTLHIRQTRALHTKAMKIYKPCGKNEILRNLLELLSGKTQNGFSLSGEELV